MSNIIAMQQAILDQELLEMPPGDVNETLSTMKNGEAMVFLERLNQVRARAIYEEAYNEDQRV